jgi:DNA-binding NarL/FixJ family response regulator
MTDVLIVDDHPLVAAATAREVVAILPGARTTCVKSVAAAEGEVAALGRDPDFILLDLVLPDAEGLSGLVRLRQAAPDAVIAIVTGETGRQVMRDAFAMGARGYLVKTHDVDAFLAGLARLLRNGFYFPPEAAEKAVDIGDRPGVLTAREHAAVRALASGKGNKQLADSLGVSESTFKSHLRAVYRKLGVRTRVQAVGRARQLGLLGPSRHA